MDDELDNEMPFVDRDHIYVAEGARKNWRACLDCKLLQSLGQFARNGCPNCPHLRFTLEEETYALDNTSENWTGILAHFQRGGWLKRATHVPDGAALGSYAVVIPPKRSVYANPHSVDVEFFTDVQFPAQRQFEQSNFAGNLSVAGGAQAGGSQGQGQQVQGNQSLHGGNASLREGVGAVAADGGNRSAANGGNYGARSAAAVGGRSAVGGAEGGNKLSSERRKSAEQGEAAEVEEEVDEALAAEARMEVGMTPGNIATGAEEGLTPAMDYMEEGQTPF
mmetsp:Transcript_16442/g.40663  ORF Transcript_16442/g.40663 Transcript_16442/m.40663 type:complete len:279 (+) Transcript_16442:246-1082(+)|eukprot:CAMPEP_0178995394 /NCGR_PEP_ID=MMETSP0795-20121207/7806_1 /TAXON_ID=88552 /ORGANISM="Amoebophrya sp., Strain Ameob2" /LENGTH=278 /DNA_ID=CAMNT_0020687703 /DNA_START=241 /DNA_END=1077 /DNA_ORIENTATION=+